MLALAEQLRPGLDADLGAARHQLRELLVGQAVEQAESADLIDAVDGALLRHQRVQRGPGSSGKFPGWCAAGEARPVVDGFWLMGFPFR